MRILATALAALIATVAIAPPAPARDEIRDQQWHLNALQIDEAHKITRGAGITVAVIDTGVDPAHPDLAGSVLDGKDFIAGQNTNGREDRDGHGTAMSGVISAHGRALGIAPESKILPVRIILNQGVTSSASSDAVDWAVDHGATVLCLAFAGETPDLAIRDALERAAGRDVLAVAGIGNTDNGSAVFPGANTHFYPEASTTLITAAGTDRSGNHAAISITGPQAVLAAPAVDIVSTGPTSINATGYRKATGTSDATAIIAGVAALVRAKFPNLSAAEVIHRMTYTADDKGPPGRDDQYGFGIVNPVKALTADVPPLQPSPSPSTSTAAAGPPKNDDPSPIVIVAAIVGVAVLLTVGFLLARRRGVV